MEIGSVRSRHCNRQCIQYECCSRTCRHEPHMLFYTQTESSPAESTGIHTVVRLISRTRHVTTFFRCSTIASHQLKHKQDLLQLLKHRLITDVTSWNSSWMIGRFLEQPPAIYATLLSPEVRKCEKDIFTLSEADITSAKECSRMLPWSYQRRACPLCP